MPDQPTTNCILSSIVTLLGGGLIGTILGHFLSIGRDARNQRHVDQVAKEARKRDFLSFMSGFRSEIERASTMEVRRIFSAKVHMFRQETAKVRDDLDLDTLSRFDTAITGLCSLRETPAGYTGNSIHIDRDSVCTAIDAVVREIE